MKNKHLPQGDRYPRNAARKTWQKRNIRRMKQYAQKMGVIFTSDTPTELIAQRLIQALNA